MTEPMQTPSAARRAATVGARSAAATVGVGIAVVAIAIATFAPIPHVAAKPASEIVTPVATPQRLVCAGSLLRLGDAEGQNASTATSLGDPYLASGGIGADAAATDFTADTGHPRLIQLAEQSSTGIVAGAESQSVQASDVTGYAAASCDSASTDTWLVGGSTAVGRTTIVTLANPGDVVSTVDLTVFGENGRVASPGASDIAVDPSSQVVISLAGLAPDVASPVVHVTSTGGSVVAHLQQSVVRGLESAGLDIVSPSTSPSLAVVVPGVTLVDPDDVENRMALDAGAADLATAVRLFVPGTTDATATIDLVPETAGGAGARFQETLAAGVVTDVPVPGLVAGSYTVTVTSTVPIVGAVRASSVAGPDPTAGSSDLAWYASPAGVSQKTAFSVANGPSPTLHVANPGDAPAQVTVTPSGGGATKKVPIAAKASVAIPVTVGTTYAFEATAPVRATVGYSSGNQLAAATVDPRVADAEPIRVYP